jgi:hypothetical protein
MLVQRFSATYDVLVDVDSDSRSHHVIIIVME